MAKINDDGNKKREHGMLPVSHSPNQQRCGGKGSERSDGRNPCELCGCKPDGAGSQSRPEGRSEQHPERDRTKQIAADKGGCERENPCTHGYTRRPLFQVPSTLPFKTWPSKGVFCAFPGNAPASTSQGCSGSNRQRSAGFPGLSVPASEPSKRAGCTVRRAIAFASGSVPLCTSIRLAESNVASPAPPGAA